MIPAPFLSPIEVPRWLGKAVVLDARAGPDAVEDYRRGHVAGAAHADLEADLSAVGDPAAGGRHPLPPIATWLARLGDWGISPTTPVIVYDAAGGGMAAARAWWMLRAVGHDAVTVVEGGWQALLAEGVPSDSRDSAARPIEPYPTDVVDWPSVSPTFVEDARMDPTWRLIDARAPARYEGSSEPLDPIAGHIPGAHNLYWQSQLDANGGFKTRSVLREHYASIMGDVPPERVICYCGSGVTACHLLLTMEACGLRGAQLYVGSWSEWCRQERPRDPA